MMLAPLQRAWLRGTLAVGAAVRPPVAADGLTMDPAMSSLLRLANRMGASEQPDIATLRRRYAAGVAITGLRADRRVRASAVDAGGRPGRRYEPVSGARATMLYFHGGAFVFGGLDTHDGLCRRLAAQAGIVVIAVDYRLAPEHPFPAAHDDAARAWRWARDTVPGPLMLGGDSAGANFAAGLALKGEAVLQVLLYPVVDVDHEAERYPSEQVFAEGYLLTAALMEECGRMLLGPDGDRRDPRLSPLRGALDGAAPAVIVAAGFDPLRDQGRAYAEALQNAGVRTHLIEEAALPHGFADFAGVVPAARRAIDRVADAIRSMAERGG